MNKNEIMIKLMESGLDKKEIICISGASLVVQGIIEETGDIDLTCNQKYYEKLDWPIKKGAFGKEIKYKDVFEIGTNLFDKKNIVSINEYQFADLQQCLKVKKMLNREKDREIICKLEKVLFKR